MFRKYRVYIISTGLLLIIAVVLYLNDRSGTLSVDPKAFAVSDTSSVTRIRLTNGQQTLVFDRQGEGWILNEGYNARPRAVKKLLSVLGGMEVNAPVSKSMVKDVMKSFSDYSLTITLESAGQLVKSYRLTENDSLGIGSFGMLSNELDPYVIHVTGYSGPVSSLFPLDPLIWRDKTVFSYRPADVLSVEVNYPDTPDKSFMYQFFGPGNIKIKALGSEKSIAINKAEAKSFLQGFASVSFQVLNNKYSQAVYDSLSQVKPLCEIKVKDSGNHLKLVRTYKIPDSGKKGAFNVNFMYALIQEDKNPVIVKYVDFDPIMMRFQDFAAK